MDWNILKILFYATRWRIFVSVLLVVLSSVAVCYVVQANRQAYAQLQNIYAESNKEEARWGQLLLQYSTLTSYGRIEYLAKQKLNMRVPSQKNIILVAP